MKTKILYSIPFFIFAIFSCTERMDVEVDSTYTRLIVEGEVTTDTMAHQVILTKSADYFHNKPLASVSNAIVTIYDGDSTVTLTENPSEPGYYYTKPDYYGTPGKNYTLKVRNVDIDNNGTMEEYTAMSELKPIGVLDSITLKYRKPFEVWEIKLYAWDPPTTDFYVFKAFKNDTLLTDTLTEINITDDVFFNGNYTNGVGSYYLQQEKVDETIKTGDVITFELNSITKDYYNFLSEALQEAYGHDPIFSGPPANVSTNLSEGAIGFFCAYSIARASVIVKEIPEKKQSP